MEKEKIQKTIDEIRSHIDYEVGDWVETCDLLPGIVQKIIVRYNEKGDYIEECVKIFYPHYAMQYPGDYCGGSNCSVDHCGVHKITPDYAMKLMALGRSNLQCLWDEMQKDYEQRPDEIPCWEDYVERKYNEIYDSKKLIKRN